MGEVYKEKIKEKREDGLTIFKSLDDNSDFIETKNILKYQLSINLDIEYNIDLSHIIDNLYYYVDALCANYIYKIKKHIKVGFRDPIWEFNELILRSSIKNHCIISALYTAKYLYLKEQNISIKELGQFSSNCGYWTLKKVINYLEQKSKRELPSQYKSEELKKRLVKIWKPIIYKERSNYTNKFIKLVESKDYKYIINSLSTWNLKKIPIYDSDFTYCVMNYTNELVQGMPCKIDKYLREMKDNKQIGCMKFYTKFNEYITNTLKEYNNNRIFKCDEGYDVNGNFPQNEVHSDAIKYVKLDIDNADKVIFNYKLERAFNKNLIDCIINEYQSLTKKNSSLFLGNSLNKVFSSCVILPNSFSRKYFIKSILKNIDLPEFHEQHNKLLDSEYNYHKLKNAIRFNDENLYNDIEKSNKKIESLFDFIIHLSCITIPIYERAFFIIAYNYFSKMYNSNSKKNINSSYNKEALSKMLDSLHDYVNENAEYLMCDFDYDYGDNIYDEINMFDKEYISTNKYLLPGEAFFRSKNIKRYIDKLNKNHVNIYQTVDSNANFLSELISDIFTRTDIYNSNVTKFSRDMFINDPKKMADMYICNVLMNASKQFK